ncbi:MAG: DNA primase [Roseovarius sp.]|nr:DNA primase [Roseovarius sp.]
MRRLALITALFVLPMTAQAENPLCDTSGDIVQAAVDARVAGTGSPEAIKTISANYTGDMARYKNAVQPLVDWVYSLSQEQLDDNVSDAYRAACLAQ